MAGPIKGLKSEPSETIISRTLRTKTFDMAYQAIHSSSLLVVLRSTGFV
jgi:hypothetical protein